MLAPPLVNWGRELVNGNKQPEESESLNTDPDRSGAFMSASASPTDADDQKSASSDTRQDYIHPVSEDLGHIESKPLHPGILCNWNLHWQHRTLRHQAQKTRSQHKPGRVSGALDDKLCTGCNPNPSWDPRSTIIMLYSSKAFSELNRCHALTVEMMHRMPNFQ